MTIKNMIFAAVLSLALLGCEGGGLGTGEDAKTDAGGAAQAFDVGAESRTLPGPIPDCQYQYRPQITADSTTWECLPMPICPWGWGDYPKDDWSGWYCKCVQDCS